MVYTQLHRAHFVSILSKDKAVHQQLVWASLPPSKGLHPCIRRVWAQSRLDICYLLVSRGVRRDQRERKSGYRNKTGKSRQVPWATSHLPCSLRSQHQVPGVRKNCIMGVSGTVVASDEELMFPNVHRNVLSEVYEVTCFSRDSSSHNIPNTSTSWASALHSDLPNLGRTSGEAQRGSE